MNSSRLLASPSTWYSWILLSYLWTDPEFSWLFGGYRDSEVKWIPPRTLSVQDGGRHIQRLLFLRHMCHFFLCSVTEDPKQMNIYSSLLFHPIVEDEQRQVMYHMCQQAQTWKDCYEEAAIPAGFDFQNYTCLYHILTYLHLYLSHEHNIFAFMKPCWNCDLYGPNKGNRDQIFPHSLPCPSRTHQTWAGWSQHILSAFFPASFHSKFLGCLACTNFQEK